MQKDAVRRPPSHACCKALLYAVDQVPVEDVSGACCLCRYMKEKVLAAGLATAYILCNGKDSRIVAKWSSFPITRCLDDCGQGNSTSSQAHGTGNREAHVSGMVIWVTVAVLIVIGVICFWYFRRFKAAGNAIQPRAGRRRRSVGPSSAKRKEKRSSSSTVALLKEAKISCHATFVYVVPSFPPFRVWSFKMLRRDLSLLAFHMCLFVQFFSVCSCLTFFSTWPSIFSKRNQYNIGDH
ncbi:hypothetical protein SEVIR_7G335700v4 [Setaria viridis]|uniref:Uncharacterized protein n=1 Tax=Setaria viridis TaxID=4556 RepID=A0A4V6D4U6_SETVI|nr:hypothetical protein SEVIR_7G335700v2 [Setaria viridis]